MGRNSGAIAASRLVAALTSVIALPLVIHELGLARFGLWESIVALASLSTLITDSAGGTLLWKMSLAWGGGDDRTLRHLVRFGIGASLLLPALLVPAALLLQSSVTRFLKVALVDAATVQRVFVALVALVILSGINGTLGALNSAMQRVRLTSLASTVGQITMYTVSIVGLKAGLDLTAMLLGAAMGQVVTAGMLVLGARASRAAPRPRGCSPERTDMPALKYFGVLSAGSGAAFLRGQTDRLILAGLASPIWVGYYSIAARLSNLLMEVSNLFYVPTIAASGALMGGGHWGGVRRLYRSTMTVVSLVSAAVGLVLIGLSGPLVFLWIGTPVPEAASILRILAVGTLVAVAITGPGTAICKGIGRPSIELRYIIAGLLLNVALTVGLVLSIGPIGTVIASSASWALGALYFAFLLHTTLKLPKLAIRRAAVTLITTGLVAVLIATVVGFLPAVESRWGALLTIAVCTPLGVGALLAVSSRTGGIGYNEARALAVTFARRLRRHPATAPVE